MNEKETSKIIAETPTHRLLEMRGNVEKILGYDIVNSTTGAIVHRVYSVHAIDMIGGLSTDEHYNVAMCKLTELAGGMMNITRIDGEKP